MSTEKPISDAAQAPAVPAGYAIMPDYRGYAHLGTGQYVLNTSGEKPAELIISIATEAEKAGRAIGELRDNPEGHVLQPEYMCVRLRFKNVAGLNALEHKLRELRAEYFAAPVAPAAAALSEEQIDAIMEQAQVFASAWSLVGGVFDSGGALETAEQEKANLRALLVGTIASQAKFDCIARKQGSVGGNDPADCDWPVCGCDEHANKVIGALEESGALKGTPIYQIGANAGGGIAWWDVDRDRYEREKKAGYMKTCVVYREAT